jgi:hypothetical protein
VWSTAKWRTAIAAETGLVEGLDADVEEGVAPAGGGRVLAVLAVLGLAVALAVLPALIAFGVAPGPVRQVAVGLGSLVAVAGGVRLAVVVVGLVRFASSQAAEIASAAID